MARTLKSIRYDLGLNQKKMAKKLGLSLAAYKTRESYKTTLSAKEAAVIVKLSGVNILDMKL